MGRDTGVRAGLDELGGVCREHRKQRTHRGKDRK